VAGAPHQEFQYAVFRRGEAQVYTCRDTSRDAGSSSWTERRDIARRRARRTRNENGLVVRNGCGQDCLAGLPALRLLSPTKYSRTNAIG